jgi:signal transduction histidine kinase
VEGLGLKREELPAAGNSLYICMPIFAKGRRTGAIAFVSSTKAAFNDAELSLMRTLANVAGIAIDNAKSLGEAEEANRLKDEFVAMVSHELRTPLTPILGCVHLLRSANLSQANFDRALDMIEKHAHVQVQIVEDLLDSSRILSGKLHVTMNSLLLVPVVEEALASIRPSAEAKDLQIITKFDDVQQPIDGDPHRLQQMVRNLLSNAVKFTPPNGRIEIAVRSDGDHVQIQVTDTGIGIPADVLPSIFDRFRKSTEGNSKVRSGLGLGLAIVRHLVELHNGSIEAASAGPGQGAVFTLRFPLAARKAATAG